jgi:hypothetical protein
LQSAASPNGGCRHWNQCHNFYLPRLSGAFSTPRFKKPLLNLNDAAIKQNNISNFVP